jgi:hypothetical protein
LFHVIAWYPGWSRYELFKLLDIIVKIVISLVWPLFPRSTY